MEKKKKVKTQALEFKRYRWAIKMFVVSICLSSLFSLLSQSVLSTLGASITGALILIFIFISVIFDMIGIAVTSCDEEFFLKKNRRKRTRKPDRIKAVSKLKKSLFILCRCSW